MFDCQILTVKYFFDPINATHSGHLLFGEIDKKERSAVIYHPHSGWLGLSPLEGGEKQEHDSAIVHSARNHHHRR